MKNRRSVPISGTPLEGAKWPRRSAKKGGAAGGKVGDPFLGSSLIYIKLLFLWGLVLLADYFLEFRFEYLWPFWLLLRSVYDSLKYQGLAFSVFFVVIAVTSDMICYLFIPVHWLFFAASTYVWVQYVWHTEKGVCVPTVMLWLLFVYIEASIRLKEFKAHLDMRNLPFHLDLCRPFAAHCIGYPVVTLGFGFKSYVGYRMRLRRQREVQRENDHYYEFLRGALPEGSAIRDDAFNPHPSPRTSHLSAATSCSTAAGVGGPDDFHGSAGAAASAMAAPLLASLSSCAAAAVSAGSGDSIANQQGISLTPGGSSGDASGLSLNGHHHHSSALNGHHSPGGSPYGGGGSSHHINGHHNSVNNLTLNGGSASLSSMDLNDVKKLNDDFDGDSTLNMDKNDKNGAEGNSGGSGSKNSKNKNDLSISSNSSSKAASKKNKNKGNNNEAKAAPGKDEIITKLESDTRRLKIDLQLSKNKENDLRDQIISFMSGERHLKSEISNLQVEKSVLESRISGLLSTRASEKATLSNLEKKLVEERKQKTDFQIKLETERKTKKEVASAERSAAQTRSEVIKLEAEIKTLRSELSGYRERAAMAENEAYTLRKYQETHGDPQVLEQKLRQFQEKNKEIEMSLSAETKLKMDLFSALGEAKREISIKQTLLNKKVKEVQELKAKIAETYAVMPTSSSASTNGSGLGGAGSLSGISTFAPSTTLSLDLPNLTSADLLFSSTGANGTAESNNSGAAANNASGSVVGKLSSALGLADLTADKLSTLTGGEGGFSFGGGKMNGNHDN